MQKPPSYGNDLHNWYTQLQNNICSALETIEKEASADIYSNWNAEKFEIKEWNYHQNGGGRMRVLKNGKVFEKAGVNVSCVWGEFPKEFAAEIPGAEENPEFWACGISLVIHPRNPYVPITHFNTRHIVTKKSWFGGGGDLTPTIPYDEDTKDFHLSFKTACDKYDPKYYEKFSKWCDEYFYIKHRKEIRGVGGIFYDYLNTNDFEKDKNFNQSVGEAFLKIYPEIVKRRMHQPWGNEELEKLLIKRGKYAEFNLVYDRGTKFGFQTGGNTEAILMSLPPLAAWN